MPMYLKRSTIRLLEASVEAISMAVTSLGLPKRYELRETTAENSVAIGLVGVSVELAMSAVIVQAKGEQALRMPSGFYKTGTHIVDDFKELISSQIPKLLFLTQNVKAPSEHLSELRSLSSKFKLLTKARAGALHAGIGPSRDVCVACANDVIKFIQLLGQSSRIKPYTETLPHTIEIQKSYDIIVDDLIKKLNESQSVEDKSKALSSIYLVIPDLPKEEPEWLEAFDRLIVTPKSNDITFLLDTLQNSKYASLVKVAKTPNALPVTIQKGNPLALPIEPQYLKKSFSDIRDRWYADRGTANGRLDQKQFDPPPIESVYMIFAFQFHLLKITDSEQAQLNAVDTWPLIASSLSYPGTLGPYWYFVRKTSDWPQLEAYMNKVAKIAGKTFEKGFKEFKSSFNVLVNQKTLSKKEGYVVKLLDAYEQASKKREKLIQLRNRHSGTDKTLCETASADLIDVINDTFSIGEMLVKLVENEYTFKNVDSRKYWARVLCEAASEIEDTQGLAAVIKDQGLSAAHTAARKAFRIIDFINYGPKIE